MNTLDLIDETMFLSPAEWEEMEIALSEPHPGYFADLAAFEGMGR